MLWDYIKQLFITALDTIITEEAVIEILIVLLVFFVPFVNKAKPLPEKEKSVRKILVWKFWTKGEWRAAVIVILLIAYHCGVFSPYLLYKKNQNTISQNQKQIAADQDKIDLMNSIAADSNFAEELGKDCLNTFQDSEWKLSAGYYILAFKYPDSSHRIEINLYPYYCFDLLMTNRNQYLDKDSFPDLPGITSFKKNLESMTNDFYKASLNPNTNEDFCKSGQLESNLEALTNVEKTFKFLTINTNAPDEVKSLPGFVRQIEKSVNELKTHAKALEN
jgi:hypothetical protein